MPFLNWVRATLSRWLLRGRVLDMWLQWKMRRLERRYFAELIEHSRRPPARERVPSGAAPAPLRQMLFITDDQWEVAELVPELKKICSVETLNLRACLQQRPADRSEAETVLQAVREFQSAQSATLRPEVVFFYARSPLLSDEVFATIRQHWPCPLLGMNLDDKIEFLDYGLFAYPRDNYVRWAGKFDLNLTNGRLMTDWYADRGFPIYYMPQGCHQKVPPPPARPEFQHEITFMGRIRPERAALVRELRRRGVPVEPFGGGWPGSGEVDLPERIFQASQISLGVGFASPSRILTTTKGRDFECPAAGACYLTTYNWELVEHFQLGKEILCYRSIDELVELFAYYRRRPEECLQIGHAAFRRCQQEHTWEIRFRNVVRKNGLVTERANVAERVVPGPGRGA